VLTIKEAASILRCSKAHVQNLLAGKVNGIPPLPFIPLGRRKLIRRESLLRWLEKAEGQC
jgi:excisionase family DNA binding protein